MAELTQLAQSGEERRWAMGQVIEATYEAGTFRPLAVIDLQEGQHVALTIEPMAMTREEAKVELQAWHAV
jgi:predicted DNA-binding antitoxin AbrB/MazE fold protein